MNNPYAFPGHHPITHEHREGMTLRDYFAGKALSDLASNYGTVPDADEVKEVAKASYKFADAMLEARDD